MQRDTLYFTLSILVIILSIGGFAFYHHTTMLNLRSDMAAQNNALQTTLQNAKSALENELFVLDQKFNLKTIELEQVDQQFHERLVGTSKEIKTVRTESQLGILEIAEKSEELESDILSINVESQDLSVIISRVIDAVVSVRTDKSIGSGAIIDSRGYIVTNNHVMEGASSAAVVTYDKKVHSVQLLARSPELDLALLKISESQGQFPKFKFASDRLLRVGQRVAAMGSPGGLDFTVTEGIVSSLLRTNNQGTEFLQTDVSINPGNSGGPLINIEGHIVGINTMKKQGFEGIGFAIKADQVEDFVDDAIRAYEQSLQ